MIGGLVRGAWLRYTRQQNLYVLGETADQNEFLLGSDVDNLAVVRPVLMDQRGRCFYCRGALTPAKRFWCKFRTETAVGRVCLVDQEWSAYATRPAPQISGMVAVAPQSLPIWNCPCWIFSANSMPLRTTAAVRKLPASWRVAASRRGGPVRWCGSGTYCFAPQRASATRRSFPGRPPPGGKRHSHPA